MPEHPWLANPYWVGGRIANEPGPAIGLWFAAVGFSFFGFLGGFKQAAVGPVLLSLTALVYLFAIWATVRGYRSRSFLVLQTFPIPIGGKLRGHVEIASDPRRFRSARSISMRLTWVLRHREGGGDFGPGDEVIWQDRHNLSPVAVQTSAWGVRLPVEFAIPVDAAPSDVYGPTKWRLEIDSGLPGVGYHASFVVPVFAVEVPELDAVTRSVADGIVHTIRVEETARGLEIHAGAFRSPGWAFFSLAMTAAFAAPVVFVRGLPPLLIMAFCLVAVILAFCTLELFFGSWHAIIGERLVSVERRPFFNSRRTVSTRAVTDVVAKFGSTDRSGRTVKPLYSVFLSIAGQKPMTIGTRIPNFREAQWIVREIRKRLGLA